MKAQTALQSQAGAAFTNPTMVEAGSLLALMNEINGSIVRRAFELFEAAVDNHLLPLPSFFSTKS